MTHYPLVPYKMTNKLLFSPLGTSGPEVYMRLIDKLMKNNAIILCGHTHKTTVSQMKDKNGSVTQFSIFSLYPADKQESSQLRYSEDGNWLKENRRIMREIKAQSTMGKLYDYLLDKVTTYKEYINTEGFGIMEVNKDKVTMKIYSDDFKSPSIEIKVKKQQAFDKVIDKK